MPDRVFEYSELVPHKKTKHFPPPPTALVQFLNSLRLQEQVRRPSVIENSVNQHKPVNCDPRDPMDKAWSSPISLNAHLRNFR